MLDGVGNGASIELPDGIQGRAWQWLYDGRGGYRVVFRARDSHLSGWTVQGRSFVERRHFMNPMVRGRAWRGEYPESGILTKIVPYSRQTGQSALRRSSGKHHSQKTTVIALHEVLYIEYFRGSPVAVTLLQEPLSSAGR